jgi:hypothetical protein
MVVLMMVCLLVLCVLSAEMISDATVGDLVLEELLQPASAGMSTADLNAVVDGFPRTAVQVSGMGTVRLVLSHQEVTAIDSKIAHVRALITTP